MSIAALGSIRLAGMTLLGNGCPVVGSLMAAPPVKIPCRWLASIVSAVKVACGADVKLSSA
jgi:hypothetical protein